MFAALQCLAAVLILCLPSSEAGKRSDALANKPANAFELSKTACLNAVTLEG